MSAPAKLPAKPHDALIDALFSAPPEPLNADLSLRVQMQAGSAVWQPSRLPGLSLCVLEYIAGVQPRMTALARLDPDVNGVVIPAQELELLVQHGIVADDETEYLHPYYLRQPRDRFGRHQHFTLFPGSRNKQQSTNGVLEFYLATGQLAETDTERRCINLSEHSLWLPGPVENTEVMPLHMHNGNNSMLVRWLDSVSFRPKLDPLGEEVLVIDGSLSDELGHYTTGSWIRNPVASWQSWAGTPGTLIYYKNGHFGEHSNTSDVTNATNARTD